MALFTGSILSVGLAPLVASCSGDIRRAVARVKSAGLHAVQWDATLKNLRPRELDRTARRDIKTWLGRSGMMLSGVDLLIGHQEWTDPATQDRAADAAIRAIEFAAEMGRVCVSLALPVKECPADIAVALAAAADGCSITLAVHGEEDPEALARFLDTHAGPIRAALDPAAALAKNSDPALLAARLADRLSIARLDDYLAPSVSGGGRCTLGDGELDILEYRVALSTAEKLQATVIDLRDLPQVWASLDMALRVWNVM